MRRPSLIVHPASAGRGLFLVLALLAGSAARAQNPPSDNVVFLHGLLADEHSWEQTANRLAQEYRIMPYRPFIEWWHHESDQAAALAQYLAPYPAGFAAVAKSNGALVARTYLQNPGKINRLVTVAGPNLGAPLTDNVLSGEIFVFPDLVMFDLTDAFTYYNENDPDIEQCLPCELVFDTMGTIFYVFHELGHVLYEFGLAVRPVAEVETPVALDLSPGSDLIRTLNSPAGMQREATNAPARAGIRAFFGPPRDMLFYTFWNGQANTISATRWTFYGLALSLYDHYSNIDPSHPNALYLRLGAFRWMNVALDMLDIDPWWLDMIGVYRGYDPITNTVYYDESDGIVPEADAILPGSEKQCRAGPTSHQVLNNDDNVFRCLEQIFDEVFYDPEAHYAGELRGCDPIAGRRANRAYPPTDSHTLRRARGCRHRQDRHLVEQRPRRGDSERERAGHRRVRGYGDDLGDDRQLHREHNAHGSA
jgi:pimeloyl-ACP methyl ester carboxylesterase